MSFLTGLLAFLIMLNLIVIIHEAGHLAAAKYFGVYCREFSIGMGPLLYKRQGKETQFSIRALPIGGYVMMAGEEDGSQDEDDEDGWLKDIPENRRLNFKPKWQQILIMAAGVIMNIVLAAILFVGLAAYRGYVVEDAKPIVYEVVENSPAQLAGLQPGDEIIKITAADGTSIEPETQTQLTEFLQFNTGLSTFEVKRADEIISLQMEPQLDEDAQMYLIGFTAQAGIRQISFLEAIGVGLQDLWDSTTAIFRTLGMLFQGKGLNSLSGPIGIYKVTDQVVSYGFASYLSLFALISLNIGIFNLLPIPALDGGRILIIALESLFRRKIPVKVVEGIIMASFIILFGILIFATYNDITRYFL